METSKPNLSLAERIRLTGKYAGIIANGIYNIGKAYIRPFFPIAREKREEFLEKILEKVAYYQPLIEEKCGVNLGEVEVKDANKLLSDRYYKSAPVVALQNAWLEGRVPDEQDYFMSFMKASLREAGRFFPHWLAENLNSPFLTYYDNTIYVPFNLTNRFIDFNLEKRSELIDYCVAHELGHPLWEKLEGDKKLGWQEEEAGPDSDVRRVWNEGFATYCAEKYFSGFYPLKKSRVKFEIGGIYVKGKNKVSDAVEKHGEGIFLEIPKKWRELEREEKEKREKEIEEQKGILMLYALGFGEKFGDKNGIR